MVSKRAPAYLSSKKHLTSKYALFNVYLATLSLSTYPSAQSNNRLSSLRGLITKRGHRRLATQKWVWLVSPLWSAWSAWFDALVGVFTSGGACMAYGPTHLELVSSAFTWLTLGRTYNTRNLVANKLDTDDSDEPAKAFFIIFGTPRYINLSNQPTFAISGSTVRNRTGWASLPGSDTNKALHFFILMATLAAYRVAKGQRRL